MTARRPLDLFSVRNPAAALEYEIAQEKASALGRLGRQLEAALSTLAAFDAARAGNLVRAPEDRTRRAALVGDAAVALWHFVVQREACGLRDSARAMRDYGVPNEVRARMGAFPAKPGGPAKAGGA